MSDLVMSRDDSGPRCYVDAIPVHLGDGITIMVEGPDGQRCLLPGRFRWTFNPSDRPQIEVFLVNPACNDGTRVRFDIPKTAEVELIWERGMALRKRRD